MTNINEEIDAFRKTYDKSLKAYTSTQGHKKLWNYFLEKVKTDDFQKAINKLRIKFNIPKAGIKTKDGVTDSYLNEYRFMIRFRQSNGIEKIKEFTEEIDKLCKKYHLHSSEWGQIIETYLIYNKIEQRYFNSHNLCLLRDLVAKKLGLGIIGNLEEDDDFIYPIAIRISPYASQRDILDYIKKMYKLEIEPRQKRYRDKNNKIGKIRSKNQSVQDINQYTYENRSLPRIKIKDLVNAKFKTDFGYEYIGKIISNEKKRRKEV